jgi:hypothetical protein
MSARHVLPLTVLAVLCLAGTAVAAPVVLYGPDLDPVTAAEKAEKELKTRDFTVVGSLADAIGRDGDLPVLFGAEVKPCSDPQPGGKPVGGVVVMAREEILNMSYTQGLLRMQRAIDALPCNAEGAETDHLYELFFLQGITHYFEGRSGQAKASLSQATAIDPARPWDEGWPPSPKPTFLEALQEMLEADPTPLRVEVDDLVVDGRPTERGRAHTIRPGGHLLQVGNDTLWVTVGQEKTLSGVVVTTASQLSAGLLSGDGSYSPWVAEKAKAEGWDEVAVLSTEGVVVFQRGTITRSTVYAAGERRPGPAPGVVAGLALVGAGGGAAAVGLGLNISSWSRGAYSGGALMPQDDYEALVGENRAGLVMAIAGAAVAAAGVAVTIAGSKAEAPSRSVGVEATATRRPPLVAPWAVGARGGFAFGLVVVGQ